MQTKISVATNTGTEAYVVGLESDSYAVLNQGEMDIRNVRKLVHTNTNIQAITKIALMDLGYFPKNRKYNLVINHAVTTSRVQS